DRRTSRRTPAWDEGVQDAEEVSAVRCGRRQAARRGDAPLPEPSLPVARPRDADQLGAGRGGHRRGRRAVRTTTLGRRAPALGATLEDVEAVEGIGPDRAEAIVEWFSDEQNRKLVAELRALGLRFEIGEEERPKEGPLKGQTFVVTGTLESFSREDAKTQLEE